MAKAAIGQLPADLLKQSCRVAVFGAFLKDFWPRSKPRLVHGRHGQQPEELCFPSLLCMHDVI